MFKYPGATKRTLHFDRWLHFARELCLANKIQIFLVGTDDMMADGFTKPVDKTSAASTGRLKPLVTTVVTREMLVIRKRMRLQGITRS